MKAAIAAIGLLYLAGCGAPSSDIAAPGTPLPTVAAKSPKLGDIIVTDDDSAKTPKATFGSTTPKIYVECPFDNVKVGSKFVTTWIADKAEGAPANYKIAEVSFDVTPLVNDLTASLTTPTKGWPVGSYHVDIALDGKTLGTAKFSIEK